MLIARQRDRTRGFLQVLPTLKARQGHSKYIFQKIIVPFSFESFNYRQLRGTLCDAIGDELTGDSRVCWQLVFWSCCYYGYWLSVPLWPYLPPPGVQVIFWLYSYDMCYWTFKKIKSCWVVQVMAIETRCLFHFFSYIFTGVEGSWKL